MPNDFNRVFQNSRTGLVEEQLQAEWLEIWNVTYQSLLRDRVG